MPRRENKPTNPYLLKLLKSMIIQKLKGDYRDELTVVERRSLKDEGIDIGSNYLIKIFSESPNVDCRYDERTLDKLAKYVDYKNWQEFSLQETNEFSKTVPLDCFPQLNKNWQAAIIEAINERMCNSISITRELDKPYVIESNYCNHYLVRNIDIRVLSYLKNYKYNHVNILAPYKYGKRTFSFHLLNKIIELNKNDAMNVRVIDIDFKMLFTQDQRKNISTLIKAFCIYISNELDLKPEIEIYWNSPNFKMNCIRYFEQKILKDIKKIDPDLRIFLNIDTNGLFENEYNKDFLPIIRLWFERAQRKPEWSSMNIILLIDQLFYSEYIESPVKGIGLEVKLNAFTELDISVLADGYNLNIDNNDIKSIKQQTDGHPHIIRLLFNDLVNKLDYKKNGITSDMIYQAVLDFYDHLIERIQRENLTNTMMDLILKKEVDYSNAKKLVELGIVDDIQNNYYIAIQSFEKYFRSILNFNESQ